MNGKAWLDKWMWEIVRLTIVGLIALGGAYWGISARVDSNYDTIADQHAEIFHQLKVHCQADEQTRHNQSVVLLVELTLIDVLDDRWKAGLRTVPPKLRTAVLDALANLPDPHDC